MKEHGNRLSLRAVVNGIRDYNLKLSPEKCEFRKSHVAYVGHVLTPEGIQPNPDKKIVLFKDMPALQNVSEIQTFHFVFIQYLGNVLI